MEPIPDLDIVPVGLTSQDIEENLSGAIATLQQAVVAVPYPFLLRLGIERGILRFETHSNCL